MNSVKQFFSDIWLRVTLGVIAIIGALVWFIDMKNSENTELKSQLDNVNSQKKADALEAQVTEKLADVADNQRQVESTQKELDQVQAKREELPKQKDLSATEIEAFWNKK